MTSDVNPDASLRPRPAAQARTRRARRAVIDAARTVFLERGYGATTIDALRARSGVPPATVYRLFGSKLGILKALVDVSIAGDDEDRPVADRPAARAALADPDPRRRIDGFARITTAVNERTQPIYRILRSAADVDPEAAALLEELGAQRAAGQGLLVRSLATSGDLVPGLRPSEAADIVHALMSPELYGLLVTDRGWAADRYRRWLVGTLVGQLLAPAGAAGGGPRGSG